jgi:glycosyltransferase 2 family protein
VIRVTIILGMVGLAAATALFLSTGIAPVVATFVTAGMGVVWAALFHFAEMSSNARAWQVLLPAHRRNTLGFFVTAVWLREAVNGLLPVARVGGEVASTQLLVRRGIRGSRAVASIILDMTVGLGSQLAFTLVGVALLLRAGGGGEGLVRAMVLALVVGAILGAAFFFVQRRGFFGGLARIASRVLGGERFAKLAGGAAKLDRSVRALYRRRAALLNAFFWHFVGWFAGAGEVWLMLYFLGQSPSVANALILESAIQAVGSVAFLVPGALGVQEAGFLSIGGLLGLTPEIALSLALARRARDVLVLAPALVVWQIGLGRWLLARNVA